MINFKYLLIVCFSSAILWTGNISASHSHHKLSVSGHIQFSTPPLFPIPHLIPHPIPHPIPPPSNPYGYCGHQASSVCTTHSGRQCGFFANHHYQPSWFSSCLRLGPWFHACVNSPNVFHGNVVFQQQCVLRGSSCVCSFPSANGYTYYEPGFVY